MAKQTVLFSGKAPLVKAEQSSVLQFVEPEKDGVRLTDNGAVINRVAESMEEPTWNAADRPQTAAVHR